MREIKFRVWIKNKQQIDFVDCLELRENVNIKYIHTRFTGLKLSPSVIELMQYTGLKDCNGREIYEGDIVKSVNTCGCKNCKNTKPIINKIEFDYALLDFIKTGGSYGNYEAEVIGNIYENSELLK